MKAYQVYSDYSEYSQIVFTDTPGKARQEAKHMDEFDFDEFTDIRVKRLPMLDGMESEEPKDSLWLNERIRTILVRDYGWQCVEPNVYEMCDDCCAKEYCDYYKDVICNVGDE